MKTLVVGPGGREHALALALSRDPGVTEVHVAPGNPGMADVATLHEVDAMDGEAVADLAASLGIDLVVIGPEAPLVAGVADVVRDRGIAVFGPSAAAARIEGSKAFAKEVMAAAGVPTAEARSCSTPAEVEAALDAFGPPYVVKDDGLAAGKGVVVTDDRPTALDHAGGCERVLVEEYLDGPEVSLFALCGWSEGAGATVHPLQPAQDFKRVADGDRGPNTGGMGAYTPLPWAPAGPGRRGARERAPADRRGDGRARDAVHRAAVRRPRAHGEGRAGGRVQRPLRRPGDPGPAGAARLTTRRDAPMAAADGTLDRVGPPRWRPGAAVAVVLASKGYPGTSSKGDVIVGTETLDHDPDVDVIHAGTALVDGDLVTAGGRVLAVTAVGRDVPDARAKAYEGVSLDLLPGRPVAHRHRPGDRRRDEGATMSEDIVLGFGDVDLDARLAEALGDFNTAATGVDDERELTVQVGDGKGLVAGLSGWTWGTAAGISMLWVREDNRARGWGSRMLAAFEAEAADRGCTQVTVSSFSFQAPGFYVRHGYLEHARTEGIPVAGSADVHLVKVRGAPLAEGARASRSTAASRSRRTRPLGSLISPQYAANRRRAAGSVERPRVSVRRTTPAALSRTAKSVRYFVQPGSVWAANAARSLISQCGAAAPATDARRCRPARTSPRRAGVGNRTVSQQRRGR